RGISVQRPRERHNRRDHLRRCGVQHGGVRDCGVASRQPRNHEPPRRQERQSYPAFSSFFSSIFTSAFCFRLDTRAASASCPSTGVSCCTRLLRCAGSTVSTSITLLIRYST